MLRRTFLVAIVVSAFLCAAAPARAAGPGAVVAIGGGGTTDAIVKKVIELAGGANAVVAVLPQASQEPDAGDESVQMWRDAGAKSAAKVSFENRAAAKAALEAATLIWIPGGDQTRFMKAIVGTGLDDVIRARQAAGAVVGGTSAGAAVLSKVMITGDADLQSLASGSTVTAEGLGVWPEVIVDQHFVRRQRQNRLASLVIDMPSLVGVGIDEATAAILQGRTVTVMGKSAVVILDARSADVTASAKGQPVAARNVKLTILRDGMSVSLQ
jgi:cyanophycinase